MTGHVNMTYLTERVAADADVPLEVAKRVIESYQDVIVRALIDGESIRETNFLSIKVVDSDERTARNPQTGELVTIPARKNVRVTVLPRVTDLVRAGTTELDGQLVTLRKLPKGARGVLPVVTVDPSKKKPRVRVAKPAKKRKRVRSSKTA